MRRIFVAIMTMTLLLMAAGCAQSSVTPGQNSGSSEQAACTVDRLAAANAVLNSQPFYLSASEDPIGTSVESFVAPDRWMLDSPVFTQIRIGTDQWIKLKLVDNVWKHSIIEPDAASTGGPVNVSPNAAAGEPNGAGDCLYTSPDGLVQTTIDSAGRPILIVTLNLKVLFNYSSAPTIDPPQS